MATNQVREIIRREIIDNGRDTRYKLDSYLFVLDGLEFHLARCGERRHVNGRELSLGLLTFAHKQFGPLACRVLNRWGINATDDFGRIVYNLIEVRVMNKQAEDRLEDFSGVTNIDTFFKGQDCYEVDKDYIKKIRGA
jgi:uncharacterized repeat protein (TIGR04138 family)